MPRQANSQGNRAKRHNLRLLSVERDNIQNKKATKIVLKSCHLIFDPWWRFRKPAGEKHGEHICVSPKPTHPPAHAQDPQSSRLSPRPFHNQQPYACLKVGRSLYPHTFRLSATTAAATAAACAGLPRNFTGDVCCSSRFPLHRRDGHRR